mmetsp:Transcript_53375/g.159313  ORF Transcript_53375/g.159313 Transcript_53375/m.159313 type:complete len:383 (+) Transcript_53375:407-1555(+)
MGRAARRREPRLVEGGGGELADAPAQNAGRCKRASLQRRRGRDSSAIWACRVRGSFRARCAGRGLRRRAGQEARPGSPDSGTLLGSGGLEERALCGRCLQGPRAAVPQGRPQVHRARQGWRGPEHAGQHRQEAQERGVEPEALRGAAARRGDPRAHDREVGQRTCGVRARLRLGVQADAGHTARYGEGSLCALLQGAQAALHGRSADLRGGEGRLPQGRQRGLRRRADGRGAGGEVQAGGRPEALGAGAESGSRDAGGEPREGAGAGPGSEVPGGGRRALHSAARGGRGRGRGRRRGAPGRRRGPRGTRWQGPRALLPLLQRPLARGLPALARRQRGRVGLGRRAGAGGPHRGVGAAQARQGEGEEEEAEGEAEGQQGEGQV